MVTPLHPITASRASRSEQPAVLSVDFIRSEGSAPEREHVRQSYDCAGGRKGSIVYKKSAPASDDDVYFSFSNISFDIRRLSTSAWNVFLCVEETS